MPVVRFFARFREEIGIDRVWIDFEGSLKEILNILIKDHPEVRGFVEEGFVAVNCRIVEDLEVRVGRCDEVAILPRFSGG